MKTRFWLLLAALLLIALTALFWPQKPVLPAVVEKQAPAGLSNAQLRRDLTHLMRVPEEDDAPFWLTATVPEPPQPRLPSAVAMTGQPSAPDAAHRTAARLRELESAAATPENLKDYNDKAILFFDQDPAAATDWLNSTQGYEHLSPALASIATNLGERGRLDIANIIIESIPDTDARRSAVLDIYSLRARNGQVTRDQLAEAGWESTDIDFIFQNKGD